MSKLDMETYMPIELNIRQQDDITIVDCRGGNNYREAAYNWKKLFEHLRKNRHAKVLLNLNQISALESAGLMEISTEAASMISEGTQLKFLAFPGKLKDVLKVIDGRNIFQFYSQEEEAIKSFK